MNNSFIRKTAFHWLLRHQDADIKQTAFCWGQHLRVIHSFVLYPYVLHWPNCLLGPKRVHYFSSLRAGGRWWPHQGHLDMNRYHGSWPTVNLTTIMSPCPPVNVWTMTGWGYIQGIYHWDVSQIPAGQSWQSQGYLDSPRDEPLLIMCLSAKGLRVVSKSEFCADFKKWFLDDQSLCIRGDITLPWQPNLFFLDI